MLNLSAEGQPAEVVTGVLDVPFDLLLKLGVSTRGCVNPKWDLGSGPYLVMDTARVG